MAPPKRNRFQIFEIDFFFKIFKKIKIIGQLNFLKTISENLKMMHGLNNFPGKFF